MRALRGHPWAFLGEVEFAGEPPVDGDCVELTDLKGRCLGAGLWNGKSQIAWRRYSRRPITLDGPLLEELVTASVNRRAGKPVCRLIWPDADKGVRAALAKLGAGATADQLVKAALGR